MYGCWSYVDYLLGLYATVDTVSSTELLWEARMARTGDLSRHKNCINPLGGLSQAHLEVPGAQKPQRNAGLGNFDQEVLRTVPLDQGSL